MILIRLCHNNNDMSTKLSFLYLKGSKTFKKKNTTNKYDAAVERTVYHNTVKQEFVENSCKIANKTFTQYKFFTC